ncbi:hypothetical protein SCAR479_08343 [Seiridium cardinale]|uniref:Uncharacterized protein n=1 Tax=Seiridium cardinale TaxID=138064 RepID=A0ABR2XMN6_9PEZI
MQAVDLPLLTTIPTTTPSTVIPDKSTPISNLFPAEQVSPEPVPAVVVAAASPPAAVAPSSPLPPLPPLSPPLVTFLLHTTLPPDPPVDVVVAAVPVLLALVEDVVVDVVFAPFPLILPSSNTVTAVMDLGVSEDAKLSTVLLATIPELVTVQTAGDNLQL